MNRVGVNPVGMKKGVSALLQQSKQERKKLSNESKIKVTVLLVIGFFLLIGAIILRIFKSISNEWRLQLDKDSVVRHDGLWESCIKRTEPWVYEECKKVFSDAFGVLSTIMQAIDVITFFLLILAVVLNSTTCYNKVKGKTKRPIEHLAIFCVVVSVVSQVTLIVCFVIDSNNVSDSSSDHFGWAFYAEIVTIVFEIVAGILIKWQFKQVKKGIEEILKKNENPKRGQKLGVKVMPTQSLPVIALQQFQPTDGLQVQHIPMMQTTDGLQVQHIPMMQTTDGLQVQHIPMMQTTDGRPVQHMPMMQPTEVLQVQHIPMQQSNSVPMYTMF